MFQTRLPALDYDLAMYISTVAPDPAYLTSTFACDQIPTEENDFQGQNSSGWCNEEATPLLDAPTRRSTRTRASPTRQVRPSPLMADDFVLLPTLQFPNIGAYRTDRVAGHAEQPRQLLRRSTTGTTSTTSTVTARSSSVPSSSRPPTAPTPSPSAPTRRGSCGSAAFPASRACTTPPTTRRSSRASSSTGEAVVELL